MAGRSPAHVVREDADTLAFLDIAPATTGHTLVVPRRHADDLLDADPADVGAVLRSAQHVARQLMQRLGADGVTLFQANRAAGWQDVLHLHVHVVPRWESDRLVKPWAHIPGNPEQLAALAERLSQG